MLHIRLSRTIVFAVLAVAMIIPASAAARGRGGIGIGVGYYGGPFYPYGYGAYGYPYGYAPYGPYGYNGGRALGEVHIKSPDSNAQIFINGALAGRAHDLKRIYLAPGTYNMEQRIGNDVQRQRIYVLANRSLKLEFDKPGTARPQAEPQPVPAPAPAPAAERQ